MDTRGQAEDTSGQSDSGEKPRQVEPATVTTRQMATAPEMARESRMAEPAVATDGQLVEAGYGHGV